MEKNARLTITSSGKSYAPPTCACRFAPLLHTLALLRFSAVVGVNFKESAVGNPIEELQSYRDAHNEFGKKLIEMADGKIFPCHALYLSVLNRSLELFDGFLILLKQDHYGCCIALFRMQLDNVLRFYGVLQTADIHDTAAKVIGGTKLSSLKDKKGEKLLDVYLKNELKQKASWVPRVYDLASGYIHLSDSHFFHMLQNAEQEEDGIWSFQLSSTYGHVETKHKDELIEAFRVTTKAIFDLLKDFESLAKSYDISALEAKYSVTT